MLFVCVQLLIVLFCVIVMCAYRVCHVFLACAFRVCFLAFACGCVCVCQCLFVFVQRWFASAGLMVMIVYVCVVRLLVRLCVCLRVCVIGRCKHEFTNKHLRRQATKHEVETNDPTYKQTTTTQQLHTTTTTIGTTT